MAGVSFAEWLADSPLSIGTIRVLGALVVAVAASAVGLLFLWLGGGTVVVGVFAGYVVTDFWRGTREES